MYLVITYAPLWTNKSKIEEHEIIKVIKVRAPLEGTVAV